MSDKKANSIIIILLIVIFIGNFLFPKWLTFLLTISLAKALIVVGLVILMRVGLVSFGQGLYYCLGGYVAGICQKFFGINDFFLIVFIGILCSLIISAILGLLLCHYREIFFAMFTLAFSMILYGIIVKTEILGSTDGFNINSPSLFFWHPTFSEGKILMLTLTLLTVYFVVLFVRKLLNSDFGYVSVATKENEIRVEYLGISPKNIIFKNYLLASILATIGGIITAFISGHVDPDMAYWTTSGEFVFVALLGGTISVIAPFAASILYEFIHMYAYNISPNTWQMILGTILLLIIIFLPKGLWSIGEIYKGKVKKHVSNS